VFDGRVDRVVGVMNTLDLLGKPADAPIQSYVRPARYVPGSKSIKDLLIELRREGDVVAVVVDEFGGAEGIITIEDIMEEVVEEMEDEYDREKKSSQWIRKLATDDYVASARVELDALNEVLGVKLPPGKYATLGGFLLAQAGEIPKPGSVIEVDGLTFTVKRSTAQAIQEVRIQR
jgi:CBS domain containing-hemolysin-like protein